MKKHLIVGLGNIGLEYVHTRHNIGFDVVERFAERHQGTFEPDRLCDHALIRLKGHQAHCIKPTTYMNLSGKAVQYWKTKLALENNQILIIADDLALPPAKLRLRGKGSDAGHNGFKSIQESLGTQDFPRLRFGIGNEYAKGRQVEFVLGKWQETEWPVISGGIDKAVEAVERYILEGLDKAMNSINQGV